MKITLLALALIVASATGALAGPLGEVWQPCDYYTSFGPNSCG
jgi:hypothetical protein